MNFIMCKAEYKGSIYSNCSIKQNHQNRLNENVNNKLRKNIVLV